MDPNNLLELMRKAVLEGDTDRMVAVFPYLDEHLTGKGALPADWSNDDERYGQHWTGDERMVRMNNIQRDVLWRKCGDYRVAFNETDYIVYPETASMMKGYAHGMIGGWSANTIEVGVDPQGRVSS